MISNTGIILVVDDDAMNRTLLSTSLEEAGYSIEMAEDGQQAIEMLHEKSVDVVLLDLLMPRMNGFQVLEQMKAESALQHIPVIIISAEEDMENVICCIEMGAEDYLMKPFNPVLLRARIRSGLEKKRLRDLEKKQEQILKETFGKYVAHEVRDAVLSGQIPLDGELKDVTVLFADLRDFTPLTESTPPKEMVKILNSYFTEMAPVIHRHHGSILRYVGDEIYAVFGAPLFLSDHPQHAVAAALDMRRRLDIVNKKLELQGYAPLRQGIGIHSGRVVAANIGSPDRLSYDLVGDTVNLASRIEGETKKIGVDILISATTRAYLSDDIALEKLPATTVKGKKDPVEIFKIL